MCIETWTAFECCCTLALGWIKRKVKVDQKKGGKLRLSCLSSKERQGLSEAVKA